MKNISLCVTIIVMTPLLCPPSNVTVAYVCPQSIDTASIPPHLPQKTTNKAPATPAELTLHKVNSPFQSGQTTIHILVPDSPSKPLPLRFLYLLPVEKQGEEKWGNPIDEVIQYDLHNKYGLICIYPTFSALPWFANHPTDPTSQQEKHLIEFVIPYVEKLYPINPTLESRLLIGFSKSGYGAWTLLLRHPDIFGKAAAWDAPLMVKRPNQYGMAPIYGTEENFRQYQIPKILSAAGNFLGPQHRLVHGGHSNFLQHHEKMNQLLEQLKIPNLYHEGPQRTHHWNSGWLPEMLPFLMATDSD